MNIIEAIKSGKRFKRPDWPEWCSEADIRDPEGGYLDITHDALLADDWEVEEPLVSITREQLYKAYAESLQEIYDMTDIKPQTGVIRLMYQKLGL